MRNQKVNPRLKKLYSILRELDCELQMLGVRSDVGLFPNPVSARETIMCCLFLLSKESNAADGYLVRTARTLIDREIDRKVERPGDVCNLGDMHAACEANGVLFAELMATYRKGFTHYVRTNMFESISQSAKGTGHAV
jgi:hypothetical protein